MLKDRSLLYSMVREGDVNVSSSFQAKVGSEYVMDDLRWRELREKWLVKAPTITLLDVKQDAMMMIRTPVIILTRHIAGIDAHARSAEPTLLRATEIKRKWVQET